MNTAPRLLILGAHPDDAEIHGGGLAAQYRQNGYPVRMISVTDGSSGHHQRPPAELIGLRRSEAANAGAVIDAEYHTWDFPDGKLQPTLEVRARIIREIRQFQPDLVLTHRTCDYHPDHRAVGQCVQDASYMVTVPHVVPEVTALRSDPVVAFLPDLFTRPTPIRPDVVIDITPQIETIAQMMACHRSQVFEWLAYHQGILDSIPEQEQDKMIWVREWIERFIGPRTERFRDFLINRHSIESAKVPSFIEVYEISEYARQPDIESLNRLFPNAMIDYAS
jgi:LmbE family N-acetylglucosaminyl deacetylase